MNVSISQDCVQFLQEFLELLDADPSVFDDFGHRKSINSSFVIYAWRLSHLLYDNFYVTGLFVLTQLLDRLQIGTYCVFDVLQSFFLRLAL